jgi:peptidyl-prolyl cis-trans isomerase SurA
MVTSFPSRALGVAIIALAAYPLIVLSLSPEAALAQSSIRVLVNDDAITSFDIKQRTQMLRVFSRNQRGEKEAIEQLIDERLMLQEAERRGTRASEDEIDQELAKRASAAKLTAAQFQQAMRQAGFDPRTFRDFVHANMVWQRIVRARFRATVDVTDQDVAAALTTRTKTPEAGEVQEAFEYMLQPIVFVLPANAGAGAEAQRRNEANAFRGKFQGCENTLQLIAGTPGIVVKPQTRREEGQMNPTLKEALAALNVGGITEPERVPEGFQIVGICAKHAIQGETTATVEVREELSNERGELMARRYLRDLRSDAVIEYR